MMEVWSVLAQHTLYNKLTYIFIIFIKRLMRNMKLRAQLVPATFISVSNFETVYIDVVLLFYR
jgi:hypothetical protein